MVGASLSLLLAVIPLQAGGQISEGWTWIVPVGLIAAILMLAFAGVLFFIDKEDSKRQSNTIENVQNRMARIESRFERSSEENIASDQTSLWLARIMAQFSEMSISQGDETPVPATKSTGEESPTSTSWRTLDTGGSGDLGLLGRARSTPASIDLLKARYGLSPNWLDVTHRLRDAAVDGRLSLTVDNKTMGHDPFPNKLKVLVVDYLFNGERFRARIREGDQLELPEPMPSHPTEHPGIPPT